MTMAEMLEAMEHLVVLNMARPGLTPQERRQAEWNRDYQMMAIKALQRGTDDLPLVLGAAIKGIATILAIAGKPEAAGVVARLIIADTAAMREIMK